MKKEIFIIDDESAILDALEVLLTAEGYTVSTFKNSTELFAALKRGIPHIFLIDILLSGEDGRLIAKKLRELQNTKDIPIIMISALPSHEVDLTTVDIEGFLPKPFDADELLRTITSVTS